MTEIPIQVKKGKPLPKKTAVGSNIDLKAAIKQKKTSRRWRAVLIVLLLIIGSLGAYIYFLQKQPVQVPFVQYLPQEATMFSVINKDKIYDQIAPKYGVISSQFSFYQWLADRTSDYFIQANLDFEQDFLSLFKEKIGLAIFEASEQSSFPFVIFLEKKAASAQINRVLDQIKKQTKKDFHLAEELYRQSNITSLKSVYWTGVVYYYTQVRNYLIISNDQALLEKTIDLIIEN